MKQIKAEKKRNWLEVKLNRPDVRNAFDPYMIEELTKVFVGVALDKDLKGVLLSGEGTSFCAGADLAWMKSMVDFTLEENLTDSERLFEMFEAVDRCPVPVVTKAHGHVMGGALGLLAASDVVIAEENTKFCFSEVRLGLAPAVISPFVVDKIGPFHARRWMLTAEVFSAIDALESGLVHKVVSAADLDAEIESMRATLSSNGREAVRETKALLHYVFGNKDWNKRRAQTTRVIAERRVSAEGQEGLKAFLEKRSPSWKE